MTPIKILIALGRKLECLGNSDISEATEHDEELQVLVGWLIKIGALLEAQGFLSVELEELQSPAALEKLQQALEKYLPQ
jgi:hypothetical protein